MKMKSGLRHLAKSALCLISAMTLCVGLAGAVSIKSSIMFLIVSGMIAATLGLSIAQLARFINLMMK